MHATVEQSSAVTAAVAMVSRGRLTGVFLADPGRDPRGDFGDIRGLVGPERKPRRLETGDAGAPRTNGSHSLKGKRD